MNKAQALSVSIIIPVYNDEDHLKTCLDAIQNQSIPPDEVIVVNNNCTDKSMTVARSYSFVKVVSEPRQGVVFARTTGFNNASSDIIGRIDADTQLGVDWVKRVKAIFSQSDIAAVSGPVGYHDAPGKHAVRFIEKNLRKITWQLGTKDDAIFLFGSNMALRKSVWDAVKDAVCMRKDIHEDIDVAIHVYNAHFSVAFDGQLPAFASSRRMNDPTKQLKKYLKVYKNTYAIHGISSPAITFAVVVVLVSQYGVKLIKRGYNTDTRQFSLKKFIENEKLAERIHPM